MAGIITDVKSDIEKLRDLKVAIEEVKKAIKDIDVNVNIHIAKELEPKLKSLTAQYDKLAFKILETEATIANSVKNIVTASSKIIQAQENLSKVAKIPTQTGNTSPQVINTGETAIIQAQAKAYEELSKEINKILGTREYNVKRMVDEMNAIRLINAEIKKITKSQGEYSTLSSAQHARLEQLNNSLLTHKTALSEVRQTLSNNVKLDNAAATSMNGLSQSLSRMRIAYRELTEEERNSPIGKELLASINQADAKIKELDATIGNHQRNVGNYKSQWNGLNMSIQQVGRELPSLAYGAKVFFSAISNNLPILADEIKRARTEYELLKKSGQSATPVWKQVITSLLSWQTALTVGITFLTLHGDKIVDWVDGLSQAKKALSKTYQAMEVFQKNVSKTSSSVIATLERLSQGWKRLGNDINAQKKFILDNKDAIDSMGVSVNDATEAERLFNANKDAFILGLLQRAKAAAVMELAAEEYKKAVQKMMEADAMPDKSSQFIQTSSFGTGYWIETDNLKKKNTKKEADDLLKSGSELVQKYAQFSEEERKTLESIGIKTTKTIIEGSIEAIEAVIALKQQSLKKVTDPKEYKRIETEIKVEQAKLAAITGSELDKEASKRLKFQQDLSRSILDADLKFQAERIAIMEDGRKKRLTQSELEHKQQKSALEKEYQDTLQKYKDLKQAVPETVETTYKARLQANDEAKAIRDKRINEEMDKALMERQKEITSVFLSEEQKRLNAIKERYDKEREWAKKSFQSGSFSSKDDYEAYLAKINDAESEERKKSLLDEYQDYADRRLAIEKKFNDDIATLQAERKNVEVKGQTDMVQQIDRAIAQATKDKAQSLVSLDFEQLKKRPEYIRAFENLKQTSSETLGSLLTQLENAKQTAAEVLSPDQLREYTSTIESIMDELTERNPFQALAERKKELAEAEEELANAKRNLDYVNGGGKIVTGMNYDKNTGKTEQSYLSTTQALENYNKAKDKAVKANARVIDAEKKASNVIRKLGDSLQDVGDSMGGLGGEIISIIGSITSTVMAGIEGMENASKVGAAAIQTIEKASVILAIISAALQIANKIASLFKQTDYMAEFRKEMEKLNYELELTRLNAEISTDENSIFGDDLWGNAIKNVLLANEVFMKYNDTLKEISDRKKYTGLMGIITENKGLKNSYDSLADSLANMQIQIRHSTWFRSAKYSSLKDAVPELFNKDGSVNMDVLKKFLGTDTFKKLSEENQKYLQEMSDYWETYQEAVDQVKDYLTNIFGELGNTMTDALVDAFENGTDAAQAFTDSVVDMLETLAKQMIYSITLTPVIENAQKKMLDVTKNEQLSEEQKFNNYISILDELTDGVLSEQERYNKFLEKYQEMAAQKGFDIFTPDEEETERTATAKSGIAASQDSVNELNGNFNAMLIYSEKTCEEVAQVREHLSYIWEAQKEGWQNVKVIRELTEKVEEHTSKIVELTEKIEKNTGDTAGGIEEMNIKGVYLKK